MLQLVSIDMVLLWLGSGDDDHDDDDDGVVMLRMTTNKSRSLFNFCSDSDSFFLPCCIGICMDR